MTKTFWVLGATAGAGLFFGFFMCFFTAHCLGFYSEKLVENKRILVATTCDEESVEI